MFSDDLPPARQMKLPPGHSEPPLPDMPRPVARTAGLRVEIRPVADRPDVAELVVCDWNGVPLTNASRVERAWLARSGSLLVNLDVLAPDPFRADR